MKIVKVFLIGGFSLYLLNILVRWVIGRIILVQKTLCNIWFAFQPHLDTYMLAVIFLGFLGLSLMWSWISNRS
jgi:hypothetical protein